MTVKPIILYATNVQTLGRTLMLRSDICQRWVSSRGYAIHRLNLFTRFLDAVAVLSKLLRRC